MGLWAFQKGVRPVEFLTEIGNLFCSRVAVTEKAWLSQGFSLFTCKNKFVSANIWKSFG